MQDDIIMSHLLIPSSSGWKFDPLSAVIGAVITALIAAVMYLFRAELGQVAQSARQSLVRLREKLTMSAQQRYLEWLLGRVATLHILSEGAPLAELYIPPRLVTPPPRPSVALNPIEPPPTIPIGTALKATPRLVITGASGSGRTALLAYIARVLAEDRAQQEFGLDEHRLPIYLHLAELAFEPEQPPQPAADAKEPPPLPDPLKPLIDALAARMPLLIQASAPGMLRSQIKSGHAAILLDGMDELDAEAQSRAVNWIKTFCQANSSVRVIITAAPGGNMPLLEAGFTAIALAPWTRAEVARLADRWARAAQGGDADAARLVAILKPVPGTSPLPIDVTLAAFVWQKRGSVPSKRVAAYEQTVDILLESVQTTSPMSPILARAILGRLALAMFQDNRLTTDHAEVEKIVTELLPPPPDAVPVTPPPSESAESGQAPPPEPPKKGVPESVETLLKCGLLVELTKDRFAFVHRRLAGYLAAWQITQGVPGTLLMEHLEDTRWADVLEFCAGLINLSPLVDMLLQRDDDLFHSRLWTAAAWAASAGPDATWRGKVLTHLAKQFMQPDQLPPLRERALKALLATQDKGIGYLFKQALASPDPLTRAEAARGLGMLGRESDLDTLAAAVQDPDEAVREAAVRGMGDIGGQAAIEHLATVLLEADEFSRKIAAETLAECGQEGHHILQEAVKENDMLVRRAAAFGLAATHEEWAREILTRLERDDPQWFVRSAATEALASMQVAQEYTLDCSPVLLEQQGWLVEWGATRGMSVGLGRSAEPVLMRAVAEADTPIRLAAIHTLAHIGGESAIEPLRAQLASPDAAIRAAAYQALEAISTRTGLKIPR